MVGLNSELKNADVNMPSPLPSSGVGVGRIELSTKSVDTEVRNDSILAPSGVEIGKELRVLAMLNSSLSVKLSEVGKPSLLPIAVEGATFIVVSSLELTVKLDMAKVVDRSILVTSD